MPIGTRRCSYRPRDLREKLLVVCVCSIAILALSGCGWNSSDNVGPNPGQKQSSAIDPRDIAIPASQDGRFSVDTPQAIRDGEMNARASGPFSNIKPLEIKQGGSLGALGLNLKTMFVDDLKDPNARIDRLESAVIAMQEDMKTLAPSMQRMAVIEQDLEALVGQLEAVLQEEGAQPSTSSYSAPTPYNAPQTQSTDGPVSLQAMQDADPMALAEDDVAAPAPAPAPTPAPKSTPSGLSVLDLRLGEHANKTRLVFDLSGATSFRADLDNAEKILIVEIEKAAWNAAASKTLSSPMVQSYSTQPLDGGNGVRVILVLKKNATISSQSMLKPEGTQSKHRLVIDLAHG
jgi:hypothetical protein